MKEEMEEVVILIARISTKKQRIDRQIRNLTRAYPTGRLIKLVHCGATVIGYKDFQKVIIEAKTRKDKKYRLVFDSVTRMSRDSDGGCELYEDLFNHNVNIEFLKEPHINTEVYRKTLENQIKLQIETGNKATDKLLNTIIDALNEFTMALAKDQIKKAFDESEKELENIRKNTKDGIEVARAKGKRIGTPKGTKLVTKKSKEAKEMILKHYKLFGKGTLNATETIKLTGIDKNTFYKYKKELLEEYADKIENTI